MKSVRGIPIAIGLLLCAVGLPAASSDGETKPLLTGQEAFTDYTKEKPGTARKITVADLPAPFATKSAGNGPKERNVVRFLRGLANARKPIVAAVQGKAVGVGTTMLLHCDYVLLSEEAQLITPFVNLALVPEAASSYLLPLRIGHARAFEMFALGEPVSASAAVAWGIANKAISNSELRAEARRVAEKIAAKPIGSLTAMKRLMRDAEKLVAQMDCESAIFVERLASAEAKEAFAAFAQKRQPDFTRIFRQ